MVRPAPLLRVIPPPTLREGPHGVVSLPLFVHADFQQHYLTLLERAEHRRQLQQICAFDLLANNADRKSGHCLLGSDGRIYLDQPADGLGQVAGNELAAEVPDCAARLGLDVKGDAVVESVAGMRYPVAAV